MMKQARTLNRIRYRDCMGNFDKPLVSIGIPTYNRSLKLGACRGIGPRAGL